MLQRHSATSYNIQIHNKVLKQVFFFLLFCLCCCAGLEAHHMYTSVQHHRAELKASCNISNNKSGYVMDAICKIVFGAALAQSDTCS